MLIINLTYLVISIILSFFINAEILSILLFLYLIFIYHSERKILYKLKSKYLLTFCVILLIFYPMTGLSNDISLPFGLIYDYSFLISSIKMIIRAIFLMLFFNQLMLNFKSINIQKLGMKIGFNDFDEIMRTSEEILPQIKNQLSEFIMEIKNGTISVRSPLNLIANFLAKLLVQKNFKN